MKEMVPCRVLYSLEASGNALNFYEYQDSEGKLGKFVPLFGLDRRKECHLCSDGKQSCEHETESGYALVSLHEFCTFEASQILSLLETCMVGRLLTSHIRNS